MSCGALNQAVDARAHRKARIDQRIELDALEVFANERQAGLIAQVAGQLLENEIGHDSLHLLGEEDYSAKLLILKENVGKLVFGSRIQVIYGCIYWLSIDCIKYKRYAGSCICNL